MQKHQLNGLIALKAVADAGSFTAAGEALGISAAAVSQTIKLLEKRLGVAVLVRTTRNTRLTDAGATFLAEAGPAIDHILQAMEKIGAYSLRPSGVLKLNLPRSAFVGLMAPLIAGFTKKHPEVKVDLTLDDNLSDVVGGGFDAGVRLMETMAKDMVAIKLSKRIRWVAVGSPGYFKRMGRPKHPKDLLSHNCILVRFGKSEVYDRWEFEQKGKEFQVQVNGNLVLDDTALVVNAAVEGIGVIYYAENSIKDKIVSGKLEVVLDQFSATTEGYYLYYPSRSQIDPKLRAFVDHIKAEARLSS